MGASAPLQATKLRSRACKVQTLSIAPPVVLLPTHLSEPMIMLRLLLTALIGLVALVPTRAQFQFPGYTPSQCLNAAAAALTGASDAKVVGALSVGISVPVGQAEIDLGMSLDDGKAPMWAYLVRSDELDTLAVIPLVRFLNQCATPPVEGLDPDFGDFEGVQFTPLPQNFVEGTALTGYLKANAEYAAWSAQNPDSAATIVLLATSDEDFMQFPAGTPFWALNWFTEDPEGLPFICLVHATTGLTICLGEDVVSVDDQGDAGRFAMAPNPATNDVVISLPGSWEGRSVRVDAVDLSGRSVALYAGAPSMPQLYLGTSGLAPGVWQVRITDGQTVSTMPLTVMH